MQTRRPAVILVLLLAASAGCTRPQAGEMSAAASDEWTRSYPLDADGELHVTSREGSVVVEATDGSTVEVVARRTVHARTDETAREVLPRVEIHEEIDPKRIAIRTEPLGGIVIGVRVEVAYMVKAPKTASLRIRAGNGGVTIRGFTGNVVASSVNGALIAERLSGGMELRSVNGDTKVSLAAVGDGLIDIRSTNGSVDLIVPETASATIQANATNGGFEAVGLNYEPLGQNGPRRFRGRLNEGGTLVELASVNGGIRVASPAAPLVAEPGPTPPDGAPPPRR